MPHQQHQKLTPPTTREWINAYVLGITEYDKHNNLPTFPNGFKTCGKAVLDEVVELCEAFFAFIWRGGPAIRVLSELSDVCHASLHFIVLIFQIFPIIGPVLYTFGLYLTCLLALPTARKHGGRYLKHGCIRNKPHCMGGSHLCAASANFKQHRDDGGFNSAKISITMVKSLMMLVVILLLSNLGGVLGEDDVVSSPPREVVILLGPPAIGKGTIGAQLGTRLEGMCHLSVGDVLRKAPAESNLGQLQMASERNATLFSDEIVLLAVKNEIDQNATACERGLILDGFPKMLSAAETLETFCAAENFVVRIAVAFQATDETLLDRMHMRAERGDTASRADDVDSIFMKRLALYRQNAPEILNFYNQKKLLWKLCTDQLSRDETFDLVFHRLVQEIDQASFKVLKDLPISDQVDASGALPVELVPEWIDSRTETFSLPAIDVNVLSSQEMPRLKDDGFELVNLPTLQPGWGKIQEYANLSPKELDTSEQDFMEHNRGNPYGAAQIIHDWLKLYLKAIDYGSEQLGESHELQLCCSTGAKIRQVAALLANPDGLVYGGNALFHTDYPSFESVLESKIHKWCGTTNGSTAAVRVEDVMDVINVWIPTRAVQNWHLGFIRPETVQNPANMRRVQFCDGYYSSGALASNLQSRPSVHYARNMTWGDAWIFKSANKEEYGKPISYSPLHGSFRLGSTPGGRTSVELRCAAIKKSFITVATD